MTKEEKQIVSVEIDKYFRNPYIDSRWFTVHIDLAIERPDDGFKPQSISDITINQESIRLVNKDLYEFSGTGKVLFRDKASKIGRRAEVEFGGQAITETKHDHMSVKDILLTTFHRTTALIPEN